MNKIIYSVLIVGLIACTPQLQKNDTLADKDVVSTLDRSVFPEAGPAPKIQLAKPDTFRLENGLKVIVVENHKLPRVSFSLVFDNDPVMEGEKAGYVSMMGDMLRRGTLNRTKAQIDEEVDFIGGTLSATANRIVASSLKKHTQTLLDLMTDVLLYPSFPEEELEKIKVQTLSSLEADMKDPDAISSNVAKKMVYGNHPYGEIMTVESVKAIAVQDCKQHYTDYIRPNNAYLAIVGDLTLEEAKEYANTFFTDWLAIDVPENHYRKPVKPPVATIVLIDRPESVQSVVKITYPIELKPGDQDEMAAKIMNQILGGSATSKLFMNLREEHGYTYGAYSRLGSDELVGKFTAFAKVRNDVTDSAVYQFIKEMDNIKNFGFNEQELADVKAFLTGKFARALESPETVARFAINTERYGLPADYYDNYLKMIDQVTMEDVLLAAKKFIKPDNAYFVVVGNAAELKEKLDKFGVVKVVDIYGNEQ